MPLLNYTHPQSLIRQLLDRIAAASIPRMATVILAPRFLLNRYGTEEAPGVAFASAGQTLAFQYENDSEVVTALDSDHSVDHDFTRVFAEDLEAQLAVFPSDGTNKFYLDSALTPHIFRLANTVLKGTGTLDPFFRGREVQIGDKVTVNDGVSGDIKRTVIGLLGKAEAASAGTNTAKDDDTAANALYNAATAAAASSSQTAAPAGTTIAVDDATAFNATVRGSKIDGKYGEEFTFTVVTAGAPGTAQVDITSASGKWSALSVDTVDATGDYSITDTNAGNELAGCDFTIVSGDDLVVGQVFKIKVFNAFTQIDTSSEVAVAGTYTGSKDTTYIVEVVTGTTGDTMTGAVVNITDTAGVDDPILSLSITEDETFALGTTGLTMEIIDPADWSDVPQGGLLAGDKYFIHCVAATNSTTSFDRVILDGPGVDTSLFVDTATAVAVTFSLDVTGEILKTDAADGSAWESTDDGVVVDGALALNVDARDTGYKWVAYTNGVGKLFASWRAAVPASSNDGLRAIDSASQILEYAGDVDVDNPAGYASQVAWEGAQGRRIYFVNVGEDSLDNWTAALKKLESTDIVTFLGAFTALPEAARLVKTHCEAQSQPDKKNFRRCYVAVNSPGKYQEVGAQSGGSPHTATIEDNGGVNTIVRFATDIDLTGFDISNGDELRVVTDPDNPDVYPISEVVSATELELITGPDAPISPAVPVEVWRADTAESQGDFVIEFAKSLNSRRAMAVWQESGTITIGSDAIEIDNGYNAAHLAGLRSALLPQQGLTRTEVSTITAAPAMYNKYTPDDLDRIASNGVAVITQEHEDGACFIRHQLTTDVANGSLYYEDSVGVVVDFIALRFKDVLAGFIGKKNVTDETITEIRAVCEDILVQATEVPYNADYGPTIVAFENLVVEVDETMPDQINITVTLRIALPVNYLDVTLHTTV